MRLVLTSGGISNISIETELRKIIGKDFKGLKMLFCITASNYEGGDMNEWLIEDLIYLKNLGFKIDVCDINGIKYDSVTIYGVQIIKNFNFIFLYNSKCKFKYLK